MGMSVRTTLATCSSVHSRTRRWGNESRVSRCTIGLMLGPLADPSRLIRRPRISDIWGLSLGAWQMAEGAVGSGRRRFLSAGIGSGGSVSFPWVAYTSTERSTGKAKEFTESCTSPFPRLGGCLRFLLLVTQLPLSALVSRVSLESSQDVPFASDT
jgi:hypothetical protein